MKSIGRNSYLEKAFLDGNIQDTEGHSIHLYRKEIGTLNLPTGKLVACDPFVCPNSLPFDLEIQPGKYRVDVTIARFDEDQRIAFACVHIGGHAPSSWTMLTTAAQSASDLKRGYFFWYPVDSGTGCFMDVLGSAALTEAMDADEQYYEKLIVEMEKNRVTTLDYLDLPLASTRLNVVMFSSGWGDGFYPTYGGFNDSGDLMNVVTDFQVFDDGYPPEGRADD